MCPDDFLATMGRMHANDLRQAVGMLPIQIFKSFGPPPAAGVTTKTTLPSAELARVAQQYPRREMFLQP